MKKLIAMIGAIAMSFGLFAADAYSISFEQAEDSQNMGVDTSSMLFTPPVSAAEWAWTGDEALPLAAYDGDAFAYGSGADARRNTAFKDQGLSANANYLPLSTGSDALTLAVGEGNIYLDQLVKFTGFEDPQTNLVAGTKIAVWMSEFENDDESTETNLYVTVGKVDANNVAEQVALKIDGTYSLDTWYRISIKSLGDIYKGAEFTTPRAAFLVYVNGQQVTVAEEDMEVATALITNVGSMDGIAKGYMAKGQLFTSIAADATFTSVGYQGIGAIDDIIVDAEGPEFCVETVETVDVVIPEVYGAVVDYVDVGGTRMQPPVSVPDGTEITVYFKPAPGKKITGGVTSVTQTISTGTATIIVSGIVAEDVVATLTRFGGTAEELAASELADALADLGVGDKIATVAACAITEGEGEAQTTLYAFTPNTTITRTATGLSIYVGNYEDGESSAAGVLEFYTGVAAGSTLTVALENTEEGMFMFAGNVAGTLTAEYLVAAADITLSGEGKVITTDGTLGVLDGDGNAVVPTAGVPEEGWYTYALSDVPPATYDITFATVANGTLETSVTNGIAAGTTVTVIATPATGYECTQITTNGTAITGTSFEMPADNVVIDATFTLQPVDPETPKHYDSKEAADAAAAEINNKKTTLIKTPTGADPEVYPYLFTAVVTADNAVVVELNEGGTNALKTAADTIETAVAGKLDDIAATAGNSFSVTVSTGVVKGFLYGIAATADLTKMGSTEPTEWVPATDDSVTIQATKPETGNAAFFQTRVKVK